MQSQPQRCSPAVSTRGHPTYQVTMQFLIINVGNYFFKCVFNFVCSHLFVLCAYAIFTQCAKGFFVTECADAT